MDIRTPLASSTGGGDLSGASKGPFEAPSDHSSAKAPSAFRKAYAFSGRKAIIRTAVVPEDTITSR